MKLQNKYALSALAGLSLLGTVAGCSSSSAADSATATSPSTSTSPSPSASASSGTSSSTGTTYKDGTYSETGSYQSPAGNDSIKVSVTLAGDVITAVTVTPNATNPTAKQYQGDFVNGIAAVVVGKIDNLNVSKVSGSSLTSTGFKAAIDKIEADAKA